MKSFRCAAALSVTALAWGQSPEGQWDQGQRRGPRMDVVFAALDADGDGELSGGEIKRAPAALAKLDRNGDGKLTEDEVRPNFGPGRPGGRGGPGGPGGPQPEDLAATLMSFDKNGDGKLSKDEVPERMQNLFARADADQDGLLTKEEVQRVAGAQRGPGEGMNGGRREGMQPGGFMRFNPILAALDRDHDGTISAEEMAAAAKSLKALDQDGDGVITLEEARPRFQRGPRPEGREERF